MNNSTPPKPDASTNPIPGGENQTSPNNASGGFLYYGSTSWSDDPNLIDVYVDTPGDNTIRPAREAFRRGPQRPNQPPSN